MSDLPNSVTKESLDVLVNSGHTEYNHLAGTLTHCSITLPCGFQVTGESACVDPANFDKELGRKYAREQAVEKLWPLEGYLLANDRHRANLALEAKAGNTYEDNASCSECKRLLLLLGDVIISKTTHNR